MGATDKGIPYVESDDLIAGWPAADKLQAETIDGLLGDNAQDLADFEATLDGGDAGQVLTKVSNADGAYDWMNPTGGGGDGSGPDLGNLGSVVSGEADNQLQLSDNGGTQDPPLLYVPPTVELLGGVAGPQHFAGAGRPDVDTGVHSADELAQLAAAPTGSVYVCVDPNDAAGKNLGAVVWRKGATDWVCVEGDTGWRAMADLQSHGLTLSAGFSPSSLSCRRVADSIQISVFANHALTANQEMLYNWADGSEAERWVAWWGYCLGQTYVSGGDYSPAVVYSGQGMAVMHGSTGHSSLYYRQSNGLPESPLPWPTEDLSKEAGPYSIEELRELIEAAQDPDHPNHDQLLQLKEELANLTGTKPGDVS